jgi:hypothetical protein
MLLFKATKNFHNPRSPNRTHINSEISRHSSLQGVQEVYLSYDECSALYKQLTRLSVKSVEHAIQAIFFLAEMFRAHLNPDKYETIAKFGEEDYFAMIIRNLPVDRDLPPTPYLNDPAIAHCPVVHLSILGMFGCIGINPLAYEGENDDSIFRHVVPKAHAEGTTSSHGSRMHLGMHVDNPHLPLIGEPIGALSACPEYLSLTGLRCELGVPTRIVDVREVLRDLPDYVRYELSRPNFCIQRPESFARRDFSIKAPLVISLLEGDFLCRYNKANVKALTPAAELALGLLETTSNSPIYERRILLQKGDFLIFKNQKTLHARDSFSARFDGTDRWMIRVFGIGDMTRTRPISTQKPFIVQA